jgi:two-component system KDP operon response regulator KdpE
MLPGMSGLEVCRLVRTESSVPIIVLSVKNAERDKVEALDLGADDYIQKPFGMGEVLARIRVALRRAIQPPKGAEPRFETGPLSVDFARRRVLVGEREVSLTPTEYDLLKVFITHRGKILTRQMLLSEVWGAEAHARTHSLHVYVALLRQKIEPLPERPRFILTIPGVGYRFADEAEPGGSNGALHKS